VPAKEEIIAAARAVGRTTLTEIESKRIISGESIPIVETFLARTRKEAISIAREIGFPVVLKVVSPQILHKSDIGGVRLGIENVSQVGKAYDAILDSVREKDPAVQIEGVSVQKMVSPGVEVIAGMSKDAQFGPVLMFGLGGIFVEVLKDVSFRIVPLSGRDARQMITEIKGYPVLKGYRGYEAVDLGALEAVLLRLSALVENTPEIRELDLNPVIARADGAVAVDARIILEPINN